MKISFICIINSLIFIEIFARIEIDFNDATKDLKKLPRFWTNVGFSPSEPVDKIDKYLMSDDLQRNLEIIGSLPNKGIENIRIHWLLNLIKVSNYTSKHRPVFDFKQLDLFLNKLIDEFRLKPTIEFMTSQNFKRIDFVTWMEFSYQIVSRYIGYYGKKSVGKWKFESWNEPDLHGYNRLNFSINDFQTYIAGIREGIRAAERLYNIERNFIKFRGPAGLFKDSNHHPFCWGILDSCNKDPKTCPIDIITFHRKGEGNNANEIVKGSIDLIENFTEKYPNLVNYKYSNSEADPIKKWSEPRNFQADSRYAAILIATVFEHWQTIYDERMKNLESLSHDNAFLNFHPNFFTQRTLLTRFQMNNTKPQHFQFVQKPVFTALGLISNVGAYAGQVKTLKGRQNVSYIVTTTNEEKFYACILIWNDFDGRDDYKNKSRQVEIQVKNIKSRKLAYFVEGIDNKRTNPSRIFEEAGKPDFPDVNLLKRMRESGYPLIIEQSTEVIDGKIILNLQLMSPFIISIRICEDQYKFPKIFNLRIRKVNNQEILIFWSIVKSKQNCISTFEIFFKDQDDYRKLETSEIPFLYHQIQHDISGCFKIRAKDFYNNYSEFSNEKCIEF